MIALSVLVLLAYACAMTENTRAGQNPPPDDQTLQEMKNKITAARARAKKYETDSNAVTQDISDLRQKLILSAQKIQQAENNVAEKEDRLDALTVRENTLTSTLKSRYGQMAKTLGAMQRLSQQPARMITYRPEKTINSLRAAGLLKILQPELKKRAKTIQQDITNLALVRENITTERQELTTILAALTSEQIDMNHLLAERRSRQSELRQATKKERQKLKEFAAKAKNLQDLVEKIKQENLTRRKLEKAALAAAKRQITKPNETKTARRKFASLPGGILSFAQEKGKMPIPARGSIKRTFGARTPEGLTSEGITIYTLPLATVISPHDGRIVFAGKFRSYGLLLIISHGPKYHTLLAGMTRIDAEVGQWVLKGEPIGQMADRPDKIKMAGPAQIQSSLGQSLYVELRRMGKPINPLPWIAAKDRKVL